LALVQPGGWLVALVKPQFEAGRAAVGKGGVVRDAAAREQAVARVRRWLEQRPGWRVLDVVPSPIAGGSGNLEFLIGAMRDG
jgi:23S rRNA (cytidine1920-2'-O)/16S rRNA (cytidine1409-2'-O)-methyltransferase